MGVPAEQRVVFESVVEGLFLRALAGRVTPELEARLKDEAKVDLRDLEPAYPIERWLQALHLAAQTLYPELPRPEALEKLGEELVHGFFQTLVGRALHGVLTLIGPRRALARTERNLRSGNNYTECTLVELGPAHFELQLNEGTDLRHVTTGLVREGLVQAGAKDVRVSLLRASPEGAKWDVRWS